MVVPETKMFCNPFWQSNFPDPFILKVRGRYYAYATENESHPTADAWVFPILTSTDLVHWQAIGKALPSLGRPYCNYWAPEVTMYNGQFLLYYAVHTSECAGGIRVAVADHPAGPFIDSGYDLTTQLVPWAIDPHVFRDQDNQWYLYMTVEYWHDPSGLTGSGNVVDRLIDPYTLEGCITRVTPPRHDWQLFEAKRQARGGVDWYTVKGPTVVRQRNRYYEMFSGGCYYKDNYAVSYAVAERPMGPGGMRDTSWHDWEGHNGNTLLLKGDREHLIGPGHNSLVLAPNNVDQYLVYHAWPPDMSERRPYLDRLFWHKDEMWTAAPTYTIQPAPARPRMQECFKGSVLQPSWQPRDGHWRVSNEAAIQDNPEAINALLLQQSPLSNACVLELNLRYVDGCGDYGILLQGNDGTTMVITMNCDAHLNLWSSAVTGTYKKSLALNTFIQTWHQLLIYLSGSLLQVYIDGSPAFATVVTQPMRTFALLTENCSAEFSCITLTDHFRDEFLHNEHTPSQLGWSVLGNSNTSQLTDWQIRDGALEQTVLTHNLQIILKGPQLTHYEFGATLKIQQADELGQSATGLLMCYSKEEQRFIWFVCQRERWQLVIEDTISVQAEKHVLALPDNFDAHQWHTLRLLYQEDQLTVYLDGPEALKLPINARPHRVGLATCATTAAFTSVWLTGLSPF